MKKVEKKITNFVVDQKLFFIIIVSIIVLGIVDRSFLTFSSLISILDHLTINGIVAAGMTVLLISGWFDLSVGGVIAFTGVITIMLQPFGLFISILGGLLAGTSVGALNGLLVVKGKINAFIVTLGTMIIFRGLSLGITNSTPVKGTIDAFKVIGQGSVLGIPYRVLLLIIIYVVVWYVLKFTKFGRNDYAIGGNLLAARLAGINVNLYTFLYFVFSSFTAAITGIVLSSSINTASAIFGTGIELLVIVSCVLGGASLFGGKGGVIGTIQGVLIFGIIERTMVVFNIDTNYQSLFRGLIIIAIVVMDTVTSKRREELVL